MIAHRDEVHRLDLWQRAFALTFGAELRAERATGPAAIVDADPGTLSAVRRELPVRPVRRPGELEAAALVARQAAARASSTRSPPRQGQLHLCRRRRLHRLEDQPPRRNDDRAQAVAAAASAACRGYPSATAAGVGRRSLRLRASAVDTAAASALTVNGLRSSSWPRKVVALAFADIAGDEQHREAARPARFQKPDQFGAGHFRHDDVADDEVEFAASNRAIASAPLAQATGS